MKSFVTFSYLFFLFHGLLWGQDPEFTLETRIPDGVCKTVFVDGNTLYTGNGAAVDIYDISQPDTLVFLGRLLTDGTVKKLYVSGNYAYIAETRLGIFIADISDPENPEITGSWLLTDGGDPVGRAEDIYPSGNYAYVAYGDYGIRALDVSDPSAPAEVGHILDDNLSLTYAYAVDVDGDYAFVANGGYGMNVIDVSDPSNMSQVGVYENSGTYPTMNDICVVDDIAYLSADWRGLIAIDISDPANPAKTDTYSAGDLAISVYASGNYAYLTEQPAYAAPDSTVGLTVIDASDPWHLTGFDSYLTPGLPYSVFVKDTLVFIADREYMELLSMQATVGKLKNDHNILQQVQRISTRKNHNIAGQQGSGRDGQLDFIKDKDFFGKSSDVVGIIDNEGNAWVISATSAGLIIVDEDGNITGGFPVNGNFNIQSQSSFIRRTDDQVLLYLITDQETAVFDITDMENISKINSFTHDEFPKIIGSLNENKFAIYATNNCLRIYDMSDPADPDPPTGTTTTAEPVSGICFYGDYVYVVEESMLEIFDGLNIDSILKESSTPLSTFPDFLNAVDAAFQWLVYTTGTGKLGLVDVSDPENPQKLREEQIGGTASDVKFLQSRSYAAVARETSGLSIFKMQSDNLTETSHYLSPSMALRLFIMYQLVMPVKDEDTTTYIYLADNEDGIYIYKSKPATGIYEDKNGKSDIWLMQNQPNPFRTVTSIQYYVPATEQVEISVFDISGKKIRTLVNKIQKEGNYSLSWNGTNNTGNKVNIGIYFYSLKLSGQKTGSKKMLFMK